MELKQFIKDLAAKLQAAGIDYCITGGYAVSVWGAPRSTLDIDLITGLKQEFGLGHYEGRGWRGFHHHATLSIAAYGFLTGQRLRTGGVKKKRDSFKGAFPTRRLYAARSRDAHSGTSQIPSRLCAI